MDRCEISTPAGVFEIFYTTRGVARLSLPSRPRPAPDTFPPQNNLLEGFMGRFSDELHRYFRGEHVIFSIPLDIRWLGRFDRRVLAIIRSIPHGEARNYGWVARRMGIAGGARAVGGACGRNPCPIIIPCHRVIEEGGGLGGYSGGLAWKRYLLKLEM